MALIPSPPPAPALLHLLSFLSFFAVIAGADEFSFIDHICNNDLGNFTSDSNYFANWESLFELIYTNQTINYGFYNFSFGQYPDIVNGIGLCRGDLNPDGCRRCLQSATVLLGERCKIQKEAIGWFEQCMLRYSNRSIFGVLETNPDSVHCDPVIKNPTVFDQVVSELLEGLINPAASGNSRRKVAEGNVTVESTNSTIFALLQCTPDLSEQDCSECLNHSSFSRIPQYCDGKTWAKNYGPGCYVGFEYSPFFAPIVGLDTPAPPPASPPSASPPALSPPGQSNYSRTVIAIVVSIGALFLILILICIYLRVRKQRHEYIAR